MVLHVFGRMDRGGAEMRSVEMLRHLDSAKIHTIYCTLARDDRPGALDEQIRASGGEVINCPLTQGFGRRFRKLLREKHVTAMHGHVQYFCGLLCFYAWQERVPVRIAHWHTTGKEHRAPLKKMQDQIMRVLINRFATHIVAVGRGAMQALWPKAENDKRCRVLRTGIDLQRFEHLRSKEEIRNELGFPLDALVLVHIGRLNPVKDQLRLLRIFSIIQKQRPNSRLLFLGGSDGDYKAEVEKEAKNLGIESLVRFQGVVQEVSGYLPAGDVMVFPSRHEGLPGSVLEAIASGVPVLASDLPGVREIQTEITDLAVLDKTASDEAWAARALELAEAFQAPEAKHSLQARLAAGTFNLEACIQGHMEVWTGCRPTRPSHPSKMAE